MLDDYCPVCRLGEVENFKCDYCSAEFCKKCGGVKKTYVGVTKGITPCLCKIDE